VTCDDCGDFGMSLVESLSPRGILEAEGTCPQCGYQFTFRKHPAPYYPDIFWENWPVAPPVQADKIERTFEEVMDHYAEQIMEAKNRAIRRVAQSGSHQGHRTIGVLKMLRWTLSRTSEQANG
jgi:hypothetical protein